MAWEMPPPNWNSPIGIELDRFFREVSRQLPDLKTTLTVFGSSPIHLCLDASFTSKDADLFVLSDEEQLRDIAASIGLGKVGAAPGQFYLEICKPWAFKTTPSHYARAHCETRHGLAIIVPHVRDILIGKLSRHRKKDQQGVEPKDLRGFARVREVTGGHPTEAELIDDLRLCPHYFISGVNAIMTDFRANVEDLWPALYGHPIDVNQQIIRPLIDEMEEMGYIESKDWMSLVRALGGVRKE